MFLKLQHVHHFCVWWKINFRNIFSARFVICARRLTLLFSRPLFSASAWNFYNYWPTRRAFSMREAEFWIAFRIVFERWNALVGLRACVRACFTLTHIRFLLLVARRCRPASHFSRFTCVKYHFFKFIAFFFRLTFLSDDVQTKMYLFQRFSNRFRARIIIWCNAR